MGAEPNAPSSHRRALRYIVECAHSKAVGQLPGAIAIWLVSDSFRSTELGTYRCGGSVGFAPTSQLSDAALNIALAPHRIQSARSMNGYLRLVKQKAAIGEVFRPCIQLRPFPSCHANYLCARLLERPTLLTHASYCRSLHQHSCPSPDFRKLLAVVSKLSRRFWIQYFHGFRRQMILLLESSVSVCKNNNSTRGIT